MADSAAADRDAAAPPGPRDGAASDGAPTDGPAPGGDAGPPPDVGPPCEHECAEGARRCLAGGESACQRGPSGCRRWAPARPCDDGDRCTTDACVEPRGCGATPIECPDDGIGCTVERCVAGTCLHTVSHAACDDADPCTTDHCLPRQDCLHGPACDDGDCCTADACDVRTGACSHAPLPCADADGDGAPACADCDETDPTIFEGAVERCGDHRDDDCDWAVDEGCPCAAEWCAAPLLAMEADVQLGFERYEPPLGLTPPHEAHVVGVQLPGDTVYIDIGCTQAPVELYLTSSLTTTWFVLSDPAAIVARIIVCDQTGQASAVLGTSGAPVERWCSGGAPLSALEAHRPVWVASWTRATHLAWLRLSYECGLPCHDEVSCAGLSCGSGDCGQSCGDCPPGGRCTPRGRCAFEVDCVDQDRDGFGAGVDCLGPDCDDARSGVSPRAAEIACNGLDDDCDPVTPDALDGDGDGYDRCGGGDPVDPDGLPADCDDGRAEVSPGQPELPCNGLDDDCDPGTPEFTDPDGDGFAVCPGAVDVATDCAEGDGDVYPGAPEVLRDGVDQDCDGADLTPSDAGGVFVAPDGDDDAPGTMAAPKRTLQAAMAAAQEGQVVFAARGATASGDTVVLEECGGCLLVDDVLLGGAGLRATLIGDCPGVRLHGNVLWAPGEPLAPGVWDAAALDACDWEGCGAASGNRCADPRLADPLAGDGHLLAGSPCVDAGVHPGTVVFPWPVVDVDGEPRPRGGGYDVGVDER